MAVVLPTPNEWAAMPWHARDRAIRTARRLLAGYGDVVDETPTRTRRTEETTARLEREWGESVRAEARRLAGEDR